MKKFTRRIFVLFLAFAAANWIFAFIYERDRSLAIKNGTHEKFLKWNAIKTPDTRYDLIFLGSSRGYSAYNPQQLDSLTGLRSYNMCTGSQNSIESLYMLRDILKFQKPKFVVYELYLHSFKAHTDFYHVIENARFMTWQGGFDLMVKGFGTSGIANYCFPLLKDLDYLKADLKNFGGHKSSSKPQKWIDGYFYNPEIADAQTFGDAPAIDSFADLDIDGRKLDALDDIANLCKQNGIVLICVRSPYPPARNAKTVDDSESVYFTRRCARLKVPFYDLNQSGRYLDADFSDFVHINSHGARKATADLGAALQPHL